MVATVAERPCIAVKVAVEGVFWVFGQGDREAQGSAKVFFNQKRGDHR